MIMDKFRRGINKVANIFNLKKNKVITGTDVYIRGRMYIEGTGITIGSHVWINSEISANPIGGNEFTSFVTYNKGNITIGNNVGLSNVAICSMASVTIDNDVMIGGSCKIYDTDFHSVEYEKRMMLHDQDIHTAPIHIKKGAFIGAHSIILKGVTIGERAVVGAGSVVTKSIPDDEIWVGNPAQFKRKI
ncbi:MAG TPA: acyltransferase [Desulfosporosinus sp.]|nr:acyltransferase [Desulfosporosinus sp.]